MNYIATAVKLTRSGDFHVTEKMVFMMGVFAPIANVGFYLMCKYGLGYQESLPLRLGAIVLTIPLLFFPRGKPFGTFHKVYWESMLVFIFPFLFANLLLHNNLNTYWYASLMWAGYIYGITSAKIYMPLAAFPVGILLAASAYMLETDGAVSTLYPAVGVFAIAWISALAMGGVKLAINVFYIISLDAAKDRLRAEDAMRRQMVLEHKNAELVARNTIISIFVRPSIVAEVDQGRDPRNFRPRSVDRAILICDMRNFTPLTESMADPEVQAQFLNKYFEMMIDPVFAAGGEVDKLMGDAVMAVFPDGKTAVDAALRMRECLQFYNKQLVVAGMPKIANVISIAKGTILEANIGSDKKLDRTLIGTAVNVSARLEAVAKLYGLDIIVSQEIMEDLPELGHTRLVDILRVKGVHRTFEVYEVYAHQAPDVVAYKDTTRDAIRRGIHAYFEEGKMAEASHIFQELLETMPPHRYRAGKLMDALVYLYAHRSRQFLENQSVVPRGLDLKSGCHDFSADLMPRDWYNIDRPEALARLRRPVNGSLQATSGYAGARIVEEAAEKEVDI